MEKKEAFEHCEQLMLGHLTRCSKKMLIHQFIIWQRMIHINIYFYRKIPLKSDGKFYIKVIIVIMTSAGAGAWRSRTSPMRVAGFTNWMAKSFTSRIFSKKYHATRIYLFVGLLYIISNTYKPAIFSFAKEISKIGNVRLQHFQGKTESPQIGNHFSKRVH